MRFFIAIEIPKNSRQELKALQDEIKDLIPEAMITENEKLHITVAFIGEQPEDLKGQLAGVIKEAVKGLRSFSLTPAFLDGFPSIHNPHTVWVGVKGDIDKLFVLRERIKDGLNNLKIQTDERRFIPHIAIAKTYKFHLTEEAEKKFQSLMFDTFSPIGVHSIKLFESVPDEGFHKHNTLAEIPFPA